MTIQRSRTKFIVTDDVHVGLGDADDSDDALPVKTLKFEFEHGKEFRIPIRVTDNEPTIESVREARLFIDFHWFLEDHLSLNLVKAIYQLVLLDKEYFMRSSGKGHWVRGFYDVIDKSIVLHHNDDSGEFLYTLAHETGHAAMEAISKKELQRFDSFVRNKIPGRVWIASVFDLGFVESHGLKINVIIAEVFADLFAAKYCSVYSDAKGERQGGLDIQLYALSRIQKKLEIENDELQDIWSFFTDMMQKYEI